MGLHRVCLENTLQWETNGHNIFKSIFGILSLLYHTLADMGIGLVILIG